ncbi:MAG TPA: universal stress protein [Polyangiaceae bacterium]|jgi:nucleotide-binding universal stress UspA family protein
MSQSNYVVVVATDYSSASELALERAFELTAARGDAELHVLHVLASELDPTLSSGVGASLPPLSVAHASLQQHVARLVSAFQERTGKTPFQRLVMHVRVDEPAFEISQMAADLAADLVVVGTHDRKGAAHWLLGSVAEIVARMAPCPVLVVREKAVPNARPVIEPPCSRCLAVRTATANELFWCEQHRERHGQRHTYHQTDRVGSETNFPLVGGSGR